MPKTHRTTVPQVLADAESLLAGTEPPQVQAVRRKLVAAANRHVIAMAESDGFDADQITEVLFLCGGAQAEVERMWKRFNRTPAQQGKSQFHLSDFVEFIRDYQSRHKPQREKRRRKKR